MSVMSMEKILRKRTSRHRVQATMPMPRFQPALINWQGFNN
jgi:hypothetical protein